MANPKNKDRWRMESFTKVDQVIPLICIAVAFLLAVNGVAIVYLHIKEKKEDEKSKVIINF